MSQLEVIDRGAVRTLALNRPERRNALNDELLDRLPVELERAAGDPEVRVVVLTGRGGAFCAGGDLDLMAGGVLSTEAQVKPAGVMGTEARDKPAGVGDLEQGVARERAALGRAETPEAEVVEHRPALLAQGRERSLRDVCAHGPHVNVFPGLLTERSLRKGADRGRPGSDR